jgi:hypothetical protein
MGKYYYERKYKTEPAGKNQSSSSVKKTDILKVKATVPRILFYSTSATAVKFSFIKKGKTIPCFTGSAVEESIFIILPTLI